MEKNKDAPRREFYRLLDEEKRLIGQLGNTGRLYLKTQRT